MEQAVEQARQGNLTYFQNLSPEELNRLQGTADEDGRCLLHAAAVGGRLEMCQFLYENGGKASLDKQDDEGWAPLHTAVSVGFQPVVEYLIACGAQVNLPNSGGRTPLHYAASKGHADLVRVLCKSKADVHAKDMTGSNPLHRAASAGQEEAARVLLKVGKARLEAEDGEGNTPLLLAVTGASKNLALYLAQLGANLEAANKAGETPLSVAGDLGPALKAAASRGNMEQDE